MAWDERNIWPYRLQTEVVAADGHEQMGWVADIGGREKHGGWKWKHWWLEDRAYKGGGVKRAKDACGSEKRGSVDRGGGRLVSEQRGK